MTKSKIALVTGGSRGLGKDMAIRLAENGKDVILTYRSRQDEGNQVVKAIAEIGQKAVALPLDVADPESRKRFITAVKKSLHDTFQTESLDYLVNNAGIGLYAAFAETSEGQLDQLYHIHFKGPYLLTQQLLPWMNEGGAIVNISSGLARFALPGYAAYGAMKAAMETLTRYQAKELGAKQIRSNIVAPGAIETDFGGGTVRDNREVNEFVASVTALGRAGLPEDIGGVVAFLCSNDAKWINAQRIEVSGGMML